VRLIQDGGMQVDGGHSHYLIVMKEIRDARCACVAKLKGLFARLVS